MNPMVKVVEIGSSQSERATHVVIGSSQSDLATFVLIDKNKEYEESVKMQLLEIKRMKEEKAKMIANELQKKLVELYKS
jgi:hypothetical protein